MARPTVIAHRGAPGPEAHENTLPAFERAAEQGAEMIECDVRRSTDGELVLLHDARIGHHPVRRLSAEELAGVAGYRQTRLGELLDWALERRIGLDVELKESSCAAAVAEQLAEFAARGGRLLVTSFLERALVTAARVAPELRTGLLISWGTSSPLRRAARCDVDALVVQMPALSHRLEQRIADARLGCLVWDFIPRRHAERLRDAGWEGVITDDVPGTLAILDSGARRPDGGAQTRPASR